MGRRGTDAGINCDVDRYVDCYASASKIYSRLWTLVLERDIHAGFGCFCYPVAYHIQLGVNYWHAVADSNAGHHILSGFAQEQPSLASAA